MKIKINEKEFYTIELPDEISIQELSVIADRLYALLKINKDSFHIDLPKENHVSEGIKEGDKITIEGQEYLIYKTQIGNSKKKRINLKMTKNLPENKKPNNQQKHPKIETKERAEEILKLHYQNRVKCMDELNFSKKKESSYHVYISKMRKKWKLK